MDHRSNARYGRLFIRGILILLCVIAIPKLATSEIDQPADQHNAPTNQKNAIPRYVRRPTGWSSRISPDSKDCAAAKLDIWFQYGTMTYTVFMPEPDLRFKASVGGMEGTTMLIGEKECLIRVRVEAVPAGTTIHD
jgi:hypothetical protein